MCSNFFGGQNIRCWKRIPDKEYQSHWLTSNNDFVFKAFFLMPFYWNNPRCTKQDIMVFVIRISSSNSESCQTLADMLAQCRADKTWEAFIPAKKKKIHTRSNRKMLKYLHIAPLSKSEGLILWSPRISVLNFISIRPAAEMLQSGPERAGRLTLLQARPETGQVSSWVRCHLVSRKRNVCPIKEFEVRLVNVCRHSFGEKTW